MLFSSFAFIFAFLPIVWIVFHLLKNAKFRAHFLWAKIFLILSSLFFYAFWKVAYLPIMLGSIIVNYFLAKAILRFSVARLCAKTGGGGATSRTTSNTLDSSKSSLQDSLESNIAFLSQGFKKAETIDKKDLDCHAKTRLRSFLLAMTEKHLFAMAITQILAMIKTIDCHAQQVAFAMAAIKILSL
ncbi:hypothetical protein [Helicobacter sp. T3_23-1056]